MAERAVTGGQATWHDYITADGHIVAEKFSGATNAVRYFILDHLGSVAVVTNETGTVLERLAYDAWGKRRNLDGSDDTTCSLSSQTTRGFTNQEQIDALCLINLNARIYDANLGRFLSPDPTVEAPFIPQDLNRYSYTGNNPLSFTDPSGLCFLGCFWKHIPVIGHLFDTLIAKPLWHEYQALKSNPLKFALYEIAKVAVAYVTAGVTDFLDEEFDIGSMSIGGVSGDTIANSMLTQAGNAAVSTGLYGGSWNNVLIASADGFVSPIIDAQFGPAFDDPDGAGSGDYLTRAQVFATKVDWEGIVEHSLAKGAEDAAIAYAMGRRNIGDAFEAGAAGTFASDVYRSYVHQGPNMIGSGDGGVYKSDQNGLVISFFHNNFGRWWSSLLGPQSFLEEGSWFSRVMDVLPAMDPTSMIHDVWSVQFLNGACLGMETCPTMMLPGFFVSAMALSSKMPPPYAMPGKQCRKSDEYPC